MSRCRRGRSCPSFRLFPLLPPTLSVFPVYFRIAVSSGLGHGVGWGKVRICPRFDYTYGTFMRTTTEFVSTLHFALRLDFGSVPGCIEDWILFPIWDDYFDWPLDIGGVNNLPKVGNEDRLAYRGCYESLHCGMLCTWYVCKLFLKYERGFSRGG